MNSLDVALIVVAAAYALSGFFQGFVVNAVATIGLLTGGLVAISVLPDVLDQQSPGVGSALLAVGLVIFAAALGQALGTYLGGGLRDVLVVRPLRWLDALAGGALGVVAVLCAGWALGYAVSGTSIPYVSAATRDSSILQRVDRLMPQGATSLLGSFNRLLDANFFPRYLEPFQAENIVPVGPPDETTLARPEVVQAKSSVTKILGQAVCNRGIEGSGFVYAKGRVMTNAHVVAGVTDPQVVLEGRSYRAKVVVFNPDLDIAVLAVDGLGAKALEFDQGGSKGQSAAVLGFPENGPFDARAARIRSEMRLKSPDIYDRGTVERHTFSVRALVRSGNSGGPLVSTDGKVLGVIFAASISDERTGYAVTAKQVQADARKGRAATQAVPTGQCA